MSQDFAVVGGEATAEGSISILIFGINDDGIGAGSHGCIDNYEPFGFKIVFLNVGFRAMVGSEFSDGDREDNFTLF